MTFENLDIQLFFVKDLSKTLEVIANMSEPLLHIRN